MIRSADDHTFEQLVRQHPRVLVKYSAVWCGHCRLFGPVFARLAADPRFGDIAFVEVDAEFNPLARQMAGVFHLPFFAAFRDGKLTAALTTTEEATVQALIETLTAQDHETK